MPRSNKDLEAENTGFKVVIENLQKEVKELKAAAADFSLALISDDDLTSELKRRDAWPKVPTIDTISDESLITLIELRKIGLYAVVKEEVSLDPLYYAGDYTCINRGYNDNGKIYNFGTPFVLQKDTYLSEKPMLQYFKPATGVKDPSLTPFGVKFNKKVPNTSESRYIETFKNNPALKGQGKGMPTPPGN